MYYKQSSVCVIYFGPLAWIFGHSEKDAIVLSAPKQGRIWEN